MIITSKRKLTSSVAILCAFMILIGIFPINLLTVRNAEAASDAKYQSGYIYFDISNIREAGESYNSSEWIDGIYMCYNEGWASPSGVFTKITDTVYGIDVSGWGNKGSSGKIIFTTKNIWDGPNGINYKDYRRTSLSEYTVATAENRIFSWNGETELIGNKKAFKLISREITPGEYIEQQSLAGKTINFKDMTETLTGDVTATFTTNSTDDSQTITLSDNAVTVPQDVNTEVAYTTVEFKSGETSLGKYNLFNESDTGVEGISYDESTCNTFYYGVTEKADDTKLSYWGAPTTGATISNKKLYLDNSSFPVGGNAPQIKIGDTNNTFAIDNEDDSIYSFTVSSVTGDEIISVIHNGTTYHFIWSDVQKDMVSVKNDIATVSSAHFKVEPNTIYFDATLSKLLYDSEGTKGSIPAGNNNIYCYLYREGAGSGVHRQLTKSAPYIKGSNTWSDVYYVELTDQDFTTYNRIIFYSSAGSGTWPANNQKASQTENLVLPSKDSSEKCFYADSGDDIVYEAFENSQTGQSYKRSGYWGKPFQVRDAESGKENKDVVKITNSSFAEDKDPDALYINSTFYDYYTDYELNGNNRKDYGGSNGGSQRNWVNFRQFDQALSDYYQNNGVSKNDAIYTGQFQPNGWNIDFQYANLDLYGWSSSGTDYNTFISNNNSSFDVSGGGEKYDYATQNIVNHTLKNSTPQTYDGKALSPYFNEDFLMGNNSKNTKLGEIYKNVAFPFTKQDVSGVDYWVFDSSKTTLAMRQEQGTSNYHLKDVGNKAWAQNVNSSGTTTGDKVSETYGFFPFNENTTPVSGKNYNYGFGTKLEFKFRLTENGTVKDSSNKDVPIKFEFSGDDDVWVFVDNQLVLDVGGDHGKVTGTIDFANLTSTVSDVKASANNTGGTNQASIASVINDTNRTDEHTLTMFYMERGMWESNMKVQFNFPDENQLQVEKQVDTSNVDNMFKGFFRDEAMQFAFDIKNFATHYPELAASTGKQEVPINVLDQEHSLSTAPGTSEPNNVFRVSSQNIGGKPDTIHWYAKDNNVNPYRGYTEKRLGTITLNTPIDISNMQYLSFDMYMQGKGIETGKAYIQLEDVSGNKANAFLTADKLYGTPVQTANTWSGFTVKLNNLTADSKNAGDFDLTQIKSIGFQYDDESNIYLDNFVFQPIIQGSTSTGFVKDQKLIPSYGSVGTQKLEIAKDAEYKSSITDNGTRKVDGNGQFILQSGETVSFYDQFRRGSYIYLNENLTNAQKLLFDTKYTMYEDDVPVTSFNTAGSSTVSGDSKDLTNVACPVTRTENPDGTVTVTGKAEVDDGRTEKVGGTTEEQEGNSYNETKKPSDSTFVFRSYSNPDAVKASTKLKVLYTNTVKTSSLTIEKKQAKFADNEPNLDGKYKFYVEFTNIGGVSLTDADGKSSVIAGPYELGVNESTTITGIPVGTKYKIHEVVSRQTEGTTSAVPDAILGFVSQTEPTQENDVPFSYGSLETPKDGTCNTWFVEGQVSYNATAFSYRFNNMRMPVISLNLEKKWSIPDGVTVTKPDTIRLRLQRYNSKTNDGKVIGWEDVPHRDVITLSESGGWQTTINDLNEFIDTSKFTFDAEGNVITDNAEKWKYRIVELDSNGAVIANGGTFDENFTVSYDNHYDEDKNQTSDNDTLTVTNTYKQKYSIRITKVDENNPNTKLKGAEFGIYDKDPNTDPTATQIAKMTTGDDGIAVFENLEKQIYYIKELKAPSGYQSSNKVIECDFDNPIEGQTLEGNVLSVTVKNTPITMPEAGGEGKDPFNFVLFGAIAIALAGGVLLLNKKYAFLHIGKSSKEVQ